MHHLYVALSALAALHAYCFARWLKQTGNAPGAFAVLFLALLCVAVPVYRLLTAP